MRKPGENRLTGDSAIRAQQHWPALKFFLTVVWCGTSVVPYAAFAVVGETTAAPTMANWLSFKPDHCEIFRAPVDSGRSRSTG
jgi:hypothetical protein